MRKSLDEITSSRTVPELEVGVLPSFPYLDIMARELAATCCRVGAQDLSPHEAGAFTGEVSGAMLAEFGCVWVLVGHSERRTLHGETDALIATKLVAALRAGLKPVLCVGEMLGEREAGITNDVVRHQLTTVLAAIDTPSLARVIVAYEPVWAIGSGRTATPEAVQQVHEFLRSLVSAWDATVGAAMPILYGGSVKAESAADLFAMPDVDGGLVGGASLDALEFAAIVRAAALNQSTDLVQTTDLIG